MTKLQRWICDRCECCACDDCWKEKDGRCRNCGCKTRHEEDDPQGHKEYRKRLFRTCLSLLRELEEAERMDAERREYTYGSRGVRLLQLKLRSTIEELGALEDEVKT